MTLNTQLEAHTHRMASPTQSEETQNWAARASGLSLNFGARRLLNAISFELAQGELVYLQGANGAGKTTLLNIMGGYQRADAGKVDYLLQGIAYSSNLPPERLARLGLGRLWQDIRLFGSLSALDNVRAASPGAVRAGPLGDALGWVISRKRRARERELAQEHLRLVGLQGRESSSCDMLSIGQMKRVALARLLQAGARVLLLDEPLAGLDAGAADTFARFLRALVDERGISILLTSHNQAPLVDRVDRKWVLEGGRLI